MNTRFFGLCNAPIAFSLSQCLHLCFVGYLLLMGAALAPVMGFMTLLYVGISASRWITWLHRWECPFSSDASNVVLEERIFRIQDVVKKVILQAHFYSVKHVDLFKDQDREASMSTLL
ncbi:hypothetical protein GN244_ATG02432 [Phytophthora infestans]|uniref:Uncharacterized protein n=1 Tax=Phytophthora infestans TaxID=4787 RepID=A0A833WP93_PHYIN|nr:hypothetical protein GN244_ATG02432 [Phytophthora infestans]KAF4127192.1 hypothetical protein GN958_ATG23651 [Phytophthora infestans]